MEITKMHDIPKGWTRTTLGKVCSKPKYGWTSKASKTGVLKYLRTSDISGGKINWETVPYCQEIPPESEKYKIYKNDILVSRAGSVGISCLIKDAPIDTVFASYLIRFKTLDGIEPKYVEYYLKSDTYWRSISDFTAGIAIPNVNASKLSNLEIPLPSQYEQRRIVAKLEKLLAKVETCRERLNKIPAILKRFRQSVLAAACSGRLTADWREQNSKVKPAERLGDGDPPSDFDLPSAWNWLLSAHAFGFVTSGSRGWARYYSDKGAIFLRVGNLNHDSIKLDLRSIQRVSPPVNAEGRRTKVIEGDILISITADVGMVALVEAGLEEAYINQHVALGRPVGNMDRRYLAYFLAAKNGGQSQFLNLQRGATKVGLGLDDIRRIWIARPPLPEQQEIVRRVEALFKIADQIEERYKKAKAHIDKLTQSILAKAFRGELVPQNQNDDPTSELLKLIKDDTLKGQHGHSGRGKRRNK